MSKKFEKKETKLDAKQEIQENIEENNFLDLEVKLKETEERNLRLMADIENMRQRFEKDRTEALRFGIQRFAEDILSVADILEMALKSIQQGDNVKTVVAGIEMIQKELDQIFERNHIKKLKSVGEVFDPQKHDALIEITEGDAKENTIVQEIKPGYMLHEKLLRPAAVGVKKSHQASK